MARFSETSKAKLATCHPILQLVMNEAIKEIDFTVLSGMRTPYEQFELYKQGRAERADGSWHVVNKQLVVTNCDGKTYRSKHNENPSMAVDIAPYPINWKDIEAFENLSKVILRIAESHGAKIKWGGHFVSFKDLPHYELA